MNQWPLNEWFATASSACYIACNIPLLVKTYRAKRCDMPWAFLLGVLAGQVFATISVLIAQTNYGLLVNYLLGMAVFVYMIAIKRKQAPLG